MSRRLKGLLAAAALIAIMASFFLLTRGGGAPRGSVVFVQVPAQASGPPAQEQAWPWLLPANGRLVLLPAGDTAAPVRTLTRSFHSACDPSLSADGSRLVFVGKRGEDDPWQVWETESGGRRARRVSEFEGDCAGPLYVPENGDPSSPCYVPDQRVLFAGRARSGAAESGDGEWQLYSCRRDGSDLQRLTYGAASTYDPVMLRDGRVVFATWHWRHRSGPQSPLSALWQMQQDGTSVDGLCPGPEGYLKRAPVQAESRLFFVTADDPTGWGAQLASIQLNRPFTTYEVVSEGLEGEFQSAHPLADGLLVVSYRPPEKGATFGLYLLDYSRRELSPFYDDPDFDEIDPVVAEPLRPSHGHVTVMLPGKTSGELYCLDVYESQLPGVRQLAPDGIKSVRVYEAAAEPAQGGMVTPVAFDGGNEEPDGGGLGKTLLGEAPVEADGSFFIEVPADRPLRWELLDGSGTVVARAPVWVWVRPFEHRGCVGCHAPRHRAPENFIPQAITRKPSAVGVDQSVPIVGFREEIMPMIEARCSTAACHGPGGAGEPRLTAAPAEAPDGSTVNAAYVNLVYGSDAATGLPRWIYPGSARTSPLLMAMSVHARADRVELREEERLMMMKWIDSGAHWDAEGSHAPPEAEARDDPYAQRP